MINTSCRIFISNPHIQGRPKVSSLEFPQNSFLQFPQRILIFQKKLFDMKIFSIKFAIKKAILIIGVKLPLLKNVHDLSKLIWPV